MSSIVRLTLGLLWLASVMTLSVPVLFVFLPFRYIRIRIANHVGTIAGWGGMRAVGCPLVINNRESISADRPALYVGNHTSIIDALWSIWISPTGTVGVAKKTVLYYPFWGQIWLLSGHLSVDRGNSASAQKSFNKTAKYVADKGLHVWMWPEGTRSKDGRLLPFKKGLVHMAVRTGLPIVPVVTVGAHRAWEKSTFKLRQTPVTVTFLDPIDTSEWSIDRIDEHVAQVREKFLEVLPEEQLPLDESELRRAVG